MESLSFVNKRKINAPLLKETTSVLLIHTWWQESVWGRNTKEEMFVRLFAVRSQPSTEEEGERTDRMDGG
jgi:hypothetical protein